MSIISLEFLLFVFGVVIVYYIVPDRFRWMVLLAASLGFYYISAGFRIIFLVFTSAVVYGGALWIEKLKLKQKQFLKENKETLTKEEKSKHKKKCVSKQRGVIAAAIILIVGVLVTFKYLNFFTDVINSVSLRFGGGQIEKTFSLVAPVGISFYTFMSIGYLVDVYWGKAGAERNFAKMMLFTSFFPHIIQGPISNYAQLSDELFAKHEFSYKNYSWGFQRLVWGLFKKMVVANAFASYTSDVLACFRHYSGITTFIGVIMYSVQLYADFSGYMDIACGVSEMLGIRLAENFNRPFFSKSIAEFWRRWHMTLGAWFKNYIFFPIAVSKNNSALSSKAQKTFGKFCGQSVLATMPLVAVWLITGFWHGASWAYIVWGGLNGMIIIFSLWMAPVYDRCKKALTINDKSATWRIFQMIRTFLIFSFLEILPETGSVNNGLVLYKHILNDRTVPGSFYELLPFVETETRLYFYAACAGVVMMLAVELIQRKKPVREYFNRLPMPVRTLIIVCLFVIVASIGVESSADGGGFIYANF